MFRKLSAALASASLVLATPAFAQAAAPAVETVGAEGESEMFGGGGDYVVGYILLATVLAGAIFAILEFTKDDEPDLFTIPPVSP